MKVFYKVELIKVHPRVAPGRRSTDPNDCPEDKRAYAMRDLGHLVRTARGHGQAIGLYAEHLVNGDLPWTKMRQVYRLFSLVRRHGAVEVEDACAKSLELDVVDVSLISRITEKSSVPGAASTPNKTNIARLRFARVPEDFRKAGGNHE